MIANRWMPCLLFLLSTLPACYFPGGPVPESPHPPAEREPVPQRVVVEEVSIDAPAPGDIPEAYSAACNRIRFLRYRPETEDGRPKPVDAVLVMIPGYMGGANSFDFLGRQLVSMAEAGGTGSLEVWAMERRPNCLEDLTGVDAAEAAGDPSLAVDYYYFGAELEGRTFRGFLCDPNVPFLAEFGLELLMEDVYTAVTTLIPDRADRRNSVFIGGHSLGGPLTALFSGWDFDGNPATLEDGGFENCAGLIGLDGTLRNPGEPIDEAAYTQRLADIRSGAAPRMDLFTGVTPEAMALLELMGLHAALAPDEEATLFREIPLSPEVELLVRLLHSRDLDHALTGSPSLLDFRYTHEALLGVFLDDNFQPVRILQTSLGFIQGGPVVRKNFPGDLADLLGMGGVIVKEGLFIPWDAGFPPGRVRGPLYSWVNFDEVGRDEDPVYRSCLGFVSYTTKTDEVTDMQDFARTLFQGPSNFAEWYFASRIRLDMEAAAAPYSTAYGLNFLHGDRLETMPRVEFLVDHIPGYNHQDVILAAVDRPGHRENEVFPPMIDFVFSHSGGTVTPLEWTGRCLLP